MRLLKPVNRMSISSEEGKELLAAITDLKDEITILKDNHLHHLALDVTALSTKVGAITDDMSRFKGWLLSGFTLTIAAVLATLT